MKITNWQSLGLQVENSNYSLACYNSFYLRKCLYRHTSDFCTRKNMSQYTIRQAGIPICKELQVALRRLWFPLTPLSVPVLLKAKRIPGRTKNGCEGLEFGEIGLVWKNMKATVVRNWKKAFYCPAVLLCLWWCFVFHFLLGPQLEIGAVQANV